ncbi:MAG: ATP-binding protein, partial [Tannerella sp.]|nr:ATP-binding protein [Tannerella sp.]
ICGISEAELLRCFQPELQALAEKRKMTADEAFAEMKKRYDGYHFAKESEDMYNPFSVLNTFASRDFADYWFKTGTPTFLAKMIVNSNFDIRSFIDNITIATRSIDDYRVGESSLVPLMYQSGYLTIKSYDPEYDEFLLGFPNEEVKYGFLNELLPVYAPEAGLDTSFSASRFVKALVRGDTEGFMTQLTAFFASIPYDAVRQARCDEQHYQYTFWLLFTLMGQFVQTEVKSAKGRADAVVKTADAIYVFEFKMDDSATAEDALRQIDDKGYLIPYTSDGRRTVKVGVEFSVAERGVKRWMEK